MQRTIRNQNLLRKQQEQRERDRLDTLLRQSKSRFSSVTDSRIAHTIKAYAQRFPAAHVDTFRQLLDVVDEKSDILEDCKARIGVHPLVNALYNLSTWHIFWKRPAETWKPRSHNIHRQFSSLARHLLCDYDVPAFMDGAWIPKAGQAHGVPHEWQEWFIHLGTGNNIRKAEKLPFPLTKMMAHKFIEAPSYLTINEALRWGQFLGIGASEKLAKALLGSKLQYNYIATREEFLLTVINFFIRHSDMLDMSQVAPMIDFIFAQKYGQNAPQPGFSMERRTIDALINQTENWHRQLAKVKDVRKLTWNSCGIEGFDRVEGAEGKPRRFVVEELLTSHLLKAEGQQMHHCVYSYSSSCYEGRSAIYSLQSDFGAGLERRLTIEVDPKLRMITQARGKYNETSTQLDKRIMDAWATKVGLSYGRQALQRWA